MLLVIFVLAAAGFWGDFRNSLKARQFREITVGVCFFAIGTALVIMQMLRMPIPNPVTAINYLYTPVSKTVAQLLS